MRDPVVPLHRPAVFVVVPGGCWCDGTGGGGVVLRRRQVERGWRRRDGKGKPFLSHWFLLCGRWYGKAMEMVSN